MRYPSDGPATTWLNVYLFAGRLRKEHKAKMNVWLPVLNKHRQPCLWLRQPNSLSFQEAGWSDPGFLKKIAHHCINHRCMAPHRCAAYFLSYEFRVRSPKQSLTPKQSLVFGTKRVERAQNVEHEPILCSQIILQWGEKAEFWTHSDIQRYMLFLSEIEK